MEARYLQKGDVILKNEKRYTVNATRIRGKRIIVQTDGGRLTFRLGDILTVD